MNKLTLKCIVTGKEVTYTSAEYIAKRIERAGSLEKLIASYVSRDAGKASKKLKKVEPKADIEIDESTKDNVFVKYDTAEKITSQRAELHGDKYVFFRNNKKVGHMYVSIAGVNGNKE
jgi:Flp pilus assembly secretin CpaC